MSDVVRAGIVLAVLVEVGTAIVIAAGWHTDPAVMGLFVRVVPLQAAIVGLFLRRRAA